MTLLEAAVRKVNLKKTYDAVVVGTGAAGGVAAKELTEGGLEVLVLEAGPLLGPTDFNSHKWPYEMPYRGFDRPGERGRTYWNQWTASEYSKNIYVKDTENPYTTPDGKPFEWVRSRVVGGKILHWARHTRRLSDYDFKAADRDGYGENWPITYSDLAPYYDKVESFVGVSGTIENIPHLPDGKFLPPLPMTCPERYIQKHAPKAGLRVIHSRAAQRTAGIHGLGKCHFCGHCDRGCDAGAMWNSVSDTLPAAAKTGRLALRPNAVVREILVDTNGKPRGVLFVDRITKRVYEARAKVIVLGASALESTRILLNSTSRFWPTGLANSSGALGRYLMDNIGGPGVGGFLPAMMGREAENEDGKAISVEVVAYRNIDTRHPKYIRSFCHEGSSGMEMFPGFARSLGGFGADFKRRVKHHSTAFAYFSTRGEMLARWENYVEIDKDRADAWGVPVLKIHCEHSDNEREMARDAAEKLRELFDALGGEVLSHGDRLHPPGKVVHEMGTCRMGSDPKKSVLNKWNQAHDLKNLFVVDGASFVTGGGYGPTLTIGALAARASAYIVEQFKRGAL